MHFTPSANYFPVLVLEPHQVFLLARNQAFFGDCAADLSHVKTQQILCFPDNSGFLFNHLWSKTLRQGDQNIFALKRAVNRNICPVSGIQIYVKICDILRIDVTKGFCLTPYQRTTMLQIVYLILRLPNQDWMVMLSS